MNEEHPTGKEGPPERDFSGPEPHVEDPLGEDADKAPEDSSREDQEVSLHGVKDTLPFLPWGGVATIREARVSDPPEYGWFSWWPW